MRITNINTIAALIDRLVSERIKYNVFEMNNKKDNMQHQQKIIDTINQEIILFFEELFNKETYDYLEEFRSTKVELLESLEHMIRGALEIGNAETCRKRTIQENQLDLMNTIKNDLWLRSACEYRVNGKNRFDKIIKKLIGLVSKWKKKN